MEGNRRRQNYFAHFPKSLCHNNLRLPPDCTRHLVFVNRALDRTPLYIRTPLYTRTLLYAYPPAAYDPTILLSTFPIH